jgi:hypothetical protein
VTVEETVFTAVTVAPAVTPVPVIVQPTLNPLTSSTANAVPEETPVLNRQPFAKPLPPTTIDFTRQPVIAPSMRTAIGLAERVSNVPDDPTPSCPFVFPPHAYNSPESNNAKLIVPPAATCVILR